MPSKDRDRHPRVGEWNKGDRQPAASLCRKYTFKTPFTASSLKASDKGGRLEGILSRLMRNKIAVDRSETTVNPHLLEFMFPYIHT